MRLALHKECKERLVETLAEAIPQILVRNGMFLDRTSCFPLFVANQVLPRDGKLHDKLESYISDFPFAEFVMDIVAVELLELDKYRPDTDPESLTEIEGFGRPEVAAESLVARFDSLPWRYAFTVALGSEPSSFLSTMLGDSYELSPKMRIVAPNETFRREFPLSTTDNKRQRRIHRRGLLFDPVESPPEWQQDSMYLQYQTEGFVGPYGGSTPALDAERMVKAFYGLALALRLFRVEVTYGLRPTQISSYVHKLVEGSWGIDTRLELDEYESRAFRSIRMHALDGALGTEASRLHWASARLADMKMVFSAGPKTEEILLASQWLFDSYTGRDELLNFVQAMVVLEILLGEKSGHNELSLGELLRNRCAYLIGTSREKRNELLDSFAKIYKVRSQIVHRGKRRLTSAERAMFHRLLWICRRVIQEEVRLLKPD